MESKLYRQLLNRAMVLCSKSEKCKADIITLFEKWGLPEEEMDQALDYLLKERFIDEERFAGNFIHDKFYLNKWGKYKIAYMLRMKRIPENIINSALENIPAGEYENNIRDLLTKKARLIKGASILEKKSRLISFGQGKGFESEIIFRIAEEILSSE